MCHKDKQGGKESAPEVKVHVEVKQLYILRLSQCSVTKTIMQSIEYNSALAIIFFSTTHVQCTY
jgi:hypothetical protein